MAVQQAGPVTICRPEQLQLDVSVCSHRASYTRLNRTVPASVFAFTNPLRACAQYDYAMRGLGKIKFPRAIKQGLFEAGFRTLGKLVNMVCVGVCCPAPVPDPPVPSSPLLASPVPGPAMCSCPSAHGCLAR